MKLKLYQIDAFAKHIFEGNPAAVIPLDIWLEDSLMQSIAAENNLSETAFFIATDKGFHIRWFTPICEVDLCGHATLATAYVIFNVLKLAQTNKITFESRSGLLNVENNKNRIQLDLPAQPPSACDIPKALLQAFKIKPVACYEAEDYLLVFENEQDIVDAKPDYNLLMKLKHRGIIITAKSIDYDFVSRFFAPKYGIDEDPVTGSAYTQLVPYWATQLGKLEFHSKQVSKRGGELLCILSGDRVYITGKAVLYLQGEINL
ncbi:MAG: PhzF family phenazine biosynthesis protein [Pseudomonadota bacterium]